MKFNEDKLTTTIIKIGELDKGDTFIDLNNFSREEVLMVIEVEGYDCHVAFTDGKSTVPVINLTTGELWGYKANEEVIPVETEEIGFRLSKLA